MPQVTVKYDPKHVRANNTLVDPIAKIVADALTCTDENGALGPEDVEVEFHSFGDMDKTNNYTIAVIVDANDYPSRRANLEERIDEITEGLQTFFKEAHVILTPDLSQRKAYVWVRLIPADFAEFILL